MSIIEQSAGGIIMPVRRPAAAGMFYSSSASELRAEVEGCFADPPAASLTGPRKIAGLVSPHAGYIYSGRVAALAYHRLAEDGLPDMAVIIGPNHRSYDPAVALTDDDAWLTPLGEVTLDGHTIYDIAAAYPEAVISPVAHMAEHSLEVQLPFLQYIYDSLKTFRIVPILIGSSGWREEGGVVGFARRLGKAIGGALAGKDAVIIASTDFTHYESSASAQAKDSKAISAIVNLDEEALVGTVAEMEISMCGVLPTAIAIAACKECGATSARELAYRNSGDVTGDYTEVVGYAALEIDR